MAGKIMGDLGNILNLTIDNKCSVSGEQTRKFTERIADILQILEKIQMIGVNI